jgi:hypothetical protein
MFVFLFFMFCFSTCVFCVSVMFCVLFYPRVHTLLFVYKFTDHCQQVETKLQLTNMCIYIYIYIYIHTHTYTRWFTYDRDYLCVHKSQFVPVIFEPPCIIIYI